MGMIVAKHVAENVEGIGYAIAEETLQQRIPALHTGGPESVSAQRTYEECFGTEEGDSAWDIELEEGPGDWEWATGTNKATGNVNLGGITLRANSYEITDHDEATPANCEFRPHILVACFADAIDNRIWSSVWWGGLRVTGDSNGEVTVGYSFDGGPLEEDSWWPNTDEDSSIVIDDEAVGFINKLRTATNLSFVGWDHEGREAIQAEFRLVGASGAIRHLWDICGWEELAPSETATQPGGRSDWRSFDGEDLGGRYVSAQTHVDISENSWQQELLFLTVRCTNNSFLEVYFGLTSANIYGDDGYIEYRFDNQTSPIGVYGNSSASGKAVFLHDVDSFIVDLRSDTTGHLFVGIWDYADYTYIDDTYTYQGGGQLGVLGVDEDVEPVLAACGY